MLALIMNDYTDSYLLEYLLHKYRIDRDGLITYLMKQDLVVEKRLLFEQFYLDYPEFEEGVAVSDQYEELLVWNCSEIDVSEEELGDYYASIKKK